MTSKRQCGCCEEMYDGSVPHNCPHCKATVAQQCEAWDNAFGDMKDQRNTEAERFDKLRDAVDEFVKWVDAKCEHKNAWLVPMGVLTKLRELGLVREDAVGQGGAAHPDPDSPSEEQP